MRIAVIPARGGSKRIPRKNIRDFAGKPMIAWSIDAAFKSELFDRIIVSTDDPEITSIALKYGAEVPFIRPLELSDDHTGTVIVIRHAISWLIKSGIHPRHVCCIYATAPFITPEHLCSAYSLLEKNQETDFVFSVAPFESSVFRAVKISEDNNVSMFWPEDEMTRTQDLPIAYHDTGQFYWGALEAWLHRDRVFTSNSRAIILPPHLVQDIDTAEDWKLAEWKFRALKCM